MSDFYDISVTLADGTTTTMGGWAGHVLLIANPASTSAHADILAELFTDYAPRGFFALGTYDANDAGGADTPFPYLTHADSMLPSNPTSWRSPTSSKATCLFNARSHRTI